MPGRGASPLMRFGRRAKDAARGVGLLYTASGNARIEVVLADLAVSAALAEGGAWRVGLVVVASAGVLALEAVNSAIEFTADRIGLDYHPLAAAAKDTAAAAVLLAALGAAALALVALGPDVAACWQALRHASPLALVAWALLLCVLGAGVVRPEPPRAQGTGRRRRTG